MLRMCLALMLALFTVRSSGRAQPTVVPSDFTVSLVAPGLTCLGPMAVDRWENLYLIDGSPPIWWINRVDSTGGITLAHAMYSRYGSGLGYSPLDGHVYTHDEDHFSSWINRIDPGGGMTYVGSTGLSEVNDVAVDSQGRVLVDTSFTLHRLESGSLTTLLPYVAPPHLEDMDVLASGAVVINRFQVVSRFEEGTSSLVPFYTPPSGSCVLSIKRCPFNSLGAGALVLTCTLSAPYVFTLYRVDLTGGNATTVAWAAAPGGCWAMAASPRGAVYWLEEASPGPLMTFDLYRIDPVPGVGSPGSLVASTSPGVLQLDIQGPLVGGDPFLLGAMADSFQPLPGIFLPVYGIIDIDPLHPAYAPAIDGIGIFGPPQALGMTPGGGQVTLLIPIPPGLSGFGVASQFLMLAPTAPNAVFYVSNLTSFVLP